MTVIRDYQFSRSLLRDPGRYEIKPFILMFAVTIKAKIPKLTPIKPKHIEAIRPSKDT